MSPYPLGLIQPSGRNCISPCDPRFTVHILANNGLIWILVWRHALNAPILLVYNQMSNLHTHSQHTAFTIEGNIGCGKSTFLKIVSKHFPSLELIQEPVDEWQNLARKGINMLEKYYKDSKRWGLTFLNYATFTRVRRFLAKNGNSGIFSLSERSILSDRHIFGPLMSDLGFIDEAEYLLFQEMYKGYEQMLQSSLPKVIYLQCSP